RGQDSSLVWLRRPGARPGLGPDRRGGRSARPRRRGREPDRRRPRHGAVPQARAPHPDCSCAGSVPDVKISLRVNGEQREADVWEGESLIVATVDLLAHNPDPNDDEIREALSGNLCRCTGYAKIFDAVRLAAGRLP